MCRPLKSAAAAAVSRPGRGSSGCVQAWQISRGPDAPGGGPWIGGPDDRGGAGRQSTRCQIFVGAPVAPRAGDLCPGRLLVAVADFAGACLHRPVVSGPGFGRLIPVPPAPVSRVDRRPGRNARRTELARPPGSRAANPARRRRSRPTQTTPRERAPRGRDFLHIFLTWPNVNRFAPTSAARPFSPCGRRWPPRQRRSDEGLRAPRIAGIERGLDAARPRR
jgi:hypothetical protein